MDYLLVDGYNIIHAWRDIFDLTDDSLEENRTKLLKILSDFQGYTHDQILVVFDAHKVDENIGTMEDYDHIKVVYTKENQTADHFIERFVHLYKGEHVIHVATGDHLEQKTVFMKGGLRMTAKELKQEIFNSRKQNPQTTYKDQISISDYLNDDIRQQLEKIRRDPDDDNTK